MIRNPDVYDEFSHVSRRFRRKFRLPIVEVEKIVAAAQKVKEWKDKPQGRGHGRGHARHPLILKVLAALRHLAAGTQFEDLEDLASVSERMLRQFVPPFLDWMHQ